MIVSAGMHTSTTALRMRYLFATIGITVTTAADVLLMSGDGDMVLKRTTNKHGIQYHKDMTGSSTYYNLLAVA